MAIECPGCGRQYDVTLFEFGRTIHCTCGELVGFEHRIELAGSSDAPRFFADAMLERVARWLRLLGLDCAFERGIDDGRLVRQAGLQHRVILTRDKDLRRDWKVLNVCVLSAEATADQLREVIERFELEPWISPFTRCSRCNRLLETVASEEVADRVPARVLEAQQVFRRCADCGRVYWPGSHVARIRRVIRERLGADGGQ